MEKIWSGLIVMGSLPKWKVQGGLIIIGDLPKWKMKGGLLGKKTWLEKSWQNKARKLGVSWLHGWPEDSYWWQDWSSHFFEIRLVVRFISFFSHSRIKICVCLLSSMQCFFLFPQSCWTSLRIFPITIQKQLCNVLRLDNMHAFLPNLEYRSPFFDVSSS